MKLIAQIVLLSAITAVSAQTRGGHAGLDLNAIDRHVNPCDDFYRFSCGTWLAHHPVPPDRGEWGRFDELQERNYEALHRILERSAVASPQRTADEQKIGDLYGACVDEKAADAKGYDPIRADLQRIDALKDKHELGALIPKLQTEGVNVFFQFSAMPDPGDATMEIGDADQGGLGLPDRDYYLREDASLKELRAAYVAHIARMFQLIGEPEARAKANAAAVLDFETELAKGSQDLVTRRDPRRTYHKLTVQELYSVCPFFEWPPYFEAVGAPKIASLNVDAPNFFRALETALVTTDLPAIQAYLRWQTIHTAAPWLAAPFVQDDFSFYARTLNGAKELRPRWRRCVDLVNNDIGFALGRKYVDENFGPDAKASALRMAREIEKMMSDDLNTLPWMSPETRRRALEKLAAVTNRVGYPDKWRDYSELEIVPGDLVGDDRRAAEFEMHRQMRKIGKPVDHNDWSMTPATVDAYYSALQNNINFPAGILEPPFYNVRADDAVNYGAIGAVIGHELTHGFDDQGRRFDAQGNLTDWWTKEDAAEFEKRAQCFIDEYSSFIATGDIHVNGKLTLGENTADNGGLRLAFMALTADLDGRRRRRIDGFTPEQRFFIGWGQIWCENRTAELAQRHALTDPHSPAQVRVNGVVSNMPDFEKAFSCREGDAMFRAPACRVW